MQCRRRNRILVVRIGEARERQRRTREMDTDEMARWRRRRWMTVEGVRNVGRMLYQTGRLPSLCRIRMRVRLTYSCTRTASRYPSYSPFRIPSPWTRAHAHSHSFEGLAKDGKKEEKRQSGQSACIGGRALYICKVDKGIIMFARFKSTSVSIDLWFWNECMLTYILRCRDIFHSRSLPLLFANIHWPWNLWDSTVFFHKKAIFTFML